MSVSYKKGDLLKAEEKFIGHGCNAKGVMGSGVARLIREASQENFSIYEKHCIRFRNLRKSPLGTVCFHEDPGKNKVYVNLITQEGFGRDPNSRYVSYIAIADSVREFAKAWGREKEKTLAIPRIGCGLGNGDWGVVMGILDDLSEATGWDFVVYDL